MAKSSSVPSFSASATSSSSVSALVLLLPCALLLARNVAAFAPPSLPSSDGGGSSSSRCRVARTAATSSSRYHRHVTMSSFLLRSTTSGDDDDDDGDDGAGEEEIEPIVGNNWMKRSSSVDFNPAELSGPNSSGGDSESIYMDVGINGLTFHTGDLSRRMHEAMMRVATKKFSGGNIPEELGDVYLLYSMDASAKEAVRAAMDGNGYALNLGDDENMQDEGAWGQITDVVLVDPSTGEPIGGQDGETKYESLIDAIAKGGWEPGDPYSFVVREVPARQKAMDLEALLRSLDPDGTLWDEAKEKGIVMPGEEIETLKQLNEDCQQRVKSSPQEATDEAGAFRGDATNKGYNVISRRALRGENRNADGTEDNKTLLHVMDSLANHGCLIVDLTDGDESTDDAVKMSKMWDVTSDFFDRVVDNENAAGALPPMQQAEGVGSTHAVVGFGSFKDGDNQFLETRIRRSDGVLLPEEMSSIVGDDGAKSMVDAFEVMAGVGKDIVRIATAASSVDADAFVAAQGSVVVSQEEDYSPSIAGLSFDEASASGILDGGGEPSDGDMKRAEILASEAAMLLTEEIMDDGRPLLDAEIDHDEGPVSMSPHRMCRYSNNSSDPKKKKKKDGGASEIFGAHTDTSFVTIVPAAKVSGLEVFDEDALKWYRPELNARRHARGVDPGGDMDSLFPWHGRYLAVMPGELLQLTSRNNIPAAVHRVVAAVDAPRLSAPVLLRARPGTRMDVERYLGSLEKADDLLVESNGMRMEEIHDALQ